MLVAHPMSQSSKGPVTNVYEPRAYTVGVLSQQATTKELVGYAVILKEGYLVFHNRFPFSFVVYVGLISHPVPEIPDSPGSGVDPLTCEPVILNHEA